MKKVFLLFVLFLTLFLSCSKKHNSNSTLRLALVTDVGDITDQSFNQTTYEACKEYSEKYDLDFKYYRAEVNTTDACVAAINKAIQEKRNVIVLPGFTFAEALVKVVDEYPDVKFIVLDVGKYAITNVVNSLGKKDWELPNNAFCAVYAEEIAGFFAGYAAVKEGYTHLGFIGGMPVPAVVHYGYGFIQGVDKAAEEKKIESDVVVEYIYTGQFFSSPEITSLMDEWYFEKDVQVVFASGGGIWTSVAESTAKAKTKMIGVDVDQSALINRYAEGMCLTSAMKGLALTVKSCLCSIADNTFDTVYAGKISNLGLVSATDIDANFVALPTKSWAMKNFSINDYRELVRNVFDGKIVISNDITKMPKTSITVNVYPEMKIE